MKKPQNFLSPEETAMLRFADKTMHKLYKAFKQYGVDAMPQGATFMRVARFEFSIGSTTRPSEVMEFARQVAAHIPREVRMFVNDKGLFVDVRYE